MDSIHIQTRTGRIRDFGVMFDVMFGVAQVGKVGVAITPAAVARPWIHGAVLGDSLQCELGGGVLRGGVRGG